MIVHAQHLEAFARLTDVWACGLIVFGLVAVMVAVPWIMGGRA